MASNFLQKLGAEQSDLTKIGAQREAELHKEFKCSMSKAKPLTKVHKRSEQDALTHSSPTSRRYVRANSPEIVHGMQGTKSENIRGRYSEPDPQESEDLKNDRELRSRVLGRRNKLSARVAGLKKA